jgi:hypothetical protein
VDETAAPTDVVRVVPLDGSDLHLPTGSFLLPPTGRFGVRPVRPTRPGRTLGPVARAAGLLLLAVVSAGVGAAVLRAVGLPVLPAVIGRKI